MSFFCPNCEDLLRPARSTQDPLKKVLKRMNCGYEQNIEPSEPKRRTGIQEDRLRKAQPVIDDGESKGNPNLIVVVLCPKCGHDKAATWQVQTRGGDEPSTHFYRCVKCGCTWREY